MTFKKVREKIISINRLSLISGISRNQIYNIELGRSVPRLDTAVRLWAVLNDLSLDFINFFDLWHDFFHESSSDPDNVV